MGEVGMAVQKEHKQGLRSRPRDNKVRLTSLLLFTEMPLKSCRDVRCTLLSLGLLRLCSFFVLPSLLHPSIYPIVFILYKYYGSGRYRGSHDSVACYSYSLIVEAT